MKILLTGATGFIGTELCDKLLQRGHQLHILSRSKKAGEPGKNYFLWNPEKNEIDLKALEGVEAVINLAGTNVGAKRWTKKYKEEILNSRVQSTRLLAETLIKTENQVKVFVNASATGLYGTDTGSKLIAESEKPGDDFLAQVVKAWENELKKLPDSVRVVALRLGIVFSDEGGALKELVTPVKFYAGAPLASGKQFISWVALEDVTEAFTFALTNENVRGEFNLVASEPVTNKEMTKQIAAEIQRPLILPNVPAFALKLLLGEFAEAIIGGSRISNQKLIDTGYKFKYPNLEGCLKHYLTHNSI